MYLCIHNQSDLLKSFIWESKARILRISRAPVMIGNDTGMNFDWTKDIDPKQNARRKNSKLS